MFKLQTRDHNGRWKDIRFSGVFETEASAWAHAARYDEDGYVDRRVYRVVMV